MRESVSLLLLPAVLAQQATISSKRGLALVETSTPDDEHYWTSSDLTWYYNWHSQPSTDFQDSELQFVPMLWGADSDTDFYGAVKSLVDSGRNVSYVLGFNEPDGCGQVHGASCLDARKAAEIWIREMEPLRNFGIKLGAPAVTGSPRGLAWLQEFFTECKGKCKADFVPVHWYGNFEGLASHVGQVNARYPNMTMWMTEYGFPNQGLEDTQEFFNMTNAFLDRLDYITHYSYFGGFRSSKSNVGPNAAMLTQKGELTDLGAWYLGQEATGNVPKGDAARIAAFAGSSAMVLAAALWCTS